MVSSESVLPAIETRTEKLTFCPFNYRKQVHVSRECFRFVIRHLVIESRWVGEFEWKLLNTEKKTNGLERWDEQIEDELFQAVFVLYTDGQFLYRRVFEEEATVTMSSEELQTVFNALVIY